jgi:hypothetical protein
MFTLLLFQGLNWATANVDAPATMPSAAATPMVNKVRSDISLLLIAERKLCRAFIRCLSFAHLPSD